MVDIIYGEIENPHERKLMLAAKVIDDIVIKMAHSMQPGIAQLVFTRSLQDMGYFVVQRDDSFEVTKNNVSSNTVCQISKEFFSTNTSFSAPFSYNSICTSYSLVERMLLIKENPTSTLTSIEQDVTKQSVIFSNYLKKRIDVEAKVYGDYILLSDEPLQLKNKSIYSKSFEAASSYIPNILYMKSMQLGAYAGGSENPLDFLNAKQNHDLDHEEIPPLKTIDAFFTGLYVFQLIKNKGLQVSPHRLSLAWFNLEKENLTYAQRKLKEDNCILEGCLYNGADAILMGGSDSCSCNSLNVKSNL